MAAFTPARCAEINRVTDDPNAHLEATVSKRKHLPRADQPAEHRPPACDQVEVAELRPLRHLSYGPTAELLRAERLPYAVVASASADVGANRVAAALRKLGPVAGGATRGGRRETTGVRS